MESNIPFTNNNKGNLIQPNQAKATTSMLKKKNDIASFSMHKMQAWLKKQNRHFTTRIN